MEYKKLIGKFADAMILAEAYIYFIVYATGVHFILSCQPNLSMQLGAGFVLVGLPIICKIGHYINEAEGYTYD